MLDSPLNLVIIGASTGGTRIIPTIFSVLSELNACILLVQHMPQFINSSFVQTLNLYSEMPVKVVEDGDPLQNGMVYVAPGELHCSILQNRTFHLWKGEKINFVCPSIDVTMLSLQTPKNGESIVGIILTGMGRDGAAGITHTKQIGGTTIAQDEKSCAIYGMPAQAVRTGCIDHVMTPAEIAAFLNEAFSVG